jgi:Uma2 family endonuclease
MATAPHRPRARKVEYPTGDGKPMAETEIHRDDMIDLIQTLQRHFAPVPKVCVSGNMLMYFEEGNRRKHISPDVFVVKGVPKKLRKNYLIWEEGKAPDCVIEITSKSTKREDLGKKRDLYRDVLRVREYFLFDPTEDYLHPPLQGFRLVGDDYIRIEPVDGRLPSEVLGLHLERDGQELRLYDPELRSRLLTPREQHKAAEQKAEKSKQEAETAKQEAEKSKQEAETAKQEAEKSSQEALTAEQRAQTAEQRAEAESVLNQKIAAENAELRRELEALRRNSSPGQ